ncbi:MAG TPA: hypothetical protein EYP32_04445, partial [Aquificaceae bacterium]|nr:hypothetical protein [Aquificaceae bacterium]
LIISSKIKNQLKALGVQLVNRENVDEDCIALVNLESPKGLEISKELKEKGIKVIGYCGHKNLSLMQEAKNLGVDLVVPNSQVAANLANILHEV